MKHIFTSSGTALFLVAGLSIPQAFSGDKMQDQAILDTVGVMTTSFAAGDIDKVMSTYAPGAVVVAQPGHSVTGEAELRAMFQEFVAAGVNFTYGAHEVIVAGDVGLHLMQWTAATPEGDQSALSIAVLRKQQDGGWRMVIDHPFGDGVMRAAE